MKTQTFKAGSELVMRITVTGADIDHAMVQYISTLGPGLARAATRDNCHPLFVTPEKTYELRIPTDGHPAFQPPTAD